MRNLNSFSDSKQVYLVPNPNSHIPVILGRSFSVTGNGQFASVLLNTLDTTVTNQRGKKLGYVLPMKTDYEETQNVKRYSVKARIMLIRIKFLRKLMNLNLLINCFQ